MALRLTRRRRLRCRIRALLWLAGAAAGWAIAGGGHGIAGIAGAACGIVAASLAEAALSYRRWPGPRSPGEGRGRARPAAEDLAAIRAQARRRALRWQTEAAPSPAGWPVPGGVLPAWNWVPPGGISERLDRVPAWVRLWYRTPFADRYAYAWMWRHGGWDVLPPGDD